MGCDGIWETVSLPDMVKQIFKDYNDPSRNMCEEVADNLLDTVIAKDTSLGIGCDNMTMILVKFIHP